MMRSTIFAGRNFKEIIRDPTSISMSIGFPTVLIIILTTMSNSIESMASIFKVENFTPSMLVMGLALLGMFLGMLMANDRNTSFLTRLFASPLKSYNFIIGYALPLVPLALIQASICFIASIIMGLDFSINTVLTILMIIPVSLLFIALGLFMGTIFNKPNQVNGFGSILLNGVIFLSGAVIPIENLGGLFKKICNLLPFVHANEVLKLTLAGNIEETIPHLIWVLGYTLVLLFPTIIIFKQKMKS